MFRFRFSLIVIYFLLINGCLMTSTRIINGHDVDISEAPYMVQLRRGQTFACGGSIITEKFISTAAHCIDENMHHSVRAGSTLREGEGQDVAVKEIRIHPEFEDSDALLNDFALMLLEKSLEFGPNVQSIQLAKTNVAVNELLFATGWGMYVVDSDYSPTLQGAHLPMISEDECKTVFKRYDPSFICAGTFDKGISPYIGDSGGALAVNNTLYGIVSFGYHLEVPYYPVAFASVAYAYEWFNEEMKKMEKIN